MRKRVADYIADFLADHGITDVFTVVGGGAMHLNDALGHNPRLHCTYNHHEQASAIAAESYARMENRMAALCVTTGPGGTNALTGVVGGYLDSIPMLVISGQVRYDTTARWSGLGIRALGDQEFDICKAVESMTKYCEMVIDPQRIRYCLEKAFTLAQSGRPGPCWLDVPLNVQSAYIDTDSLVGYDEETPAFEPTDEAVQAVIDRLLTAKRPVFNAGNGIRIAGAFDLFRKAVEALNIPVVTGWNSIDLMEDDHPLYVGRAGIMGDRPGNFAVQNSDFVLSVGSRLSIRQVGYNYKTWAREAFVAMVDIDGEELKKPTLHVELPIQADAGLFLQKLLDKLPKTPLSDCAEWRKQCAAWKQNYPVVQPKHYEQGDVANVYCFVKELSRRLPEGRITVVGNGSACVVGSHAYEIHKNQRFIINSAIASMGYDLPAAIGACIAEGRPETVCLTGDGSIQMNLQELQTIRTNRLPIKIFVINNGGYHSIRQTQKNFFGEPLVGIGPDSGNDLEFPAMEKLADVYGYPYYAIRTNEEMNKLDEVLAQEGNLICEVFVSDTQNFEPKAASKRLEDGTMVSAPLEDMAPFLPTEELQKNLYITPVAQF